jgi:DNA polymerase III epsilon subunit-like protein
MDVMVDLETLSTRPHALILVIGAIKFNRNGKISNLKEMNTFYRRITISSCIEKGMHTDEGTRQWWNKQDPKIKEEAFGEPRTDLFTALRKFIEWFGESKWIWSHGATFDCVILKEAFLRCGLETPWKFWNERDTRTLFDVAGVQNSDLPQAQKHHALYDCHRQICGVKMSMKKIEFFK